MISRILASGFLAATIALVGCGGGDEVSPTPEACAYCLTFTVDTTYTDADGNALAEVKDGEKVYVVGDFTGWNPNNESYAMTDNGDGTWSLTLDLPHTAKNADGSDLMELTTGTAIFYKFAKTSSDPADEWSEGVKDVVDTCGDGKGLMETGNFEYTITAESHTFDTYMVEAWRDTAESYGYTSCP